MKQHTHFTPCLDTQTVLHYLSDEPEPHTHTLPHPHTHTIYHVEKQQVSVLSIYLFLEPKYLSQVKVLVWDSPHSMFAI